MAQLFPIWRIFVFLCVVVRDTRPSSVFGAGEARELLPLATVEEWN